ncbi:MAG TPA: aspartate carbamoyltransferase [Syntrophobacteraceae bacterium]|nr:aspartate carbamoyltransferase [Syntrophobacteraceae bacterium]
MPLQSKHLLGLDGMKREDIQLILDTAVSFREVLERPIKKVPPLQGKTVANMFFENSTRTRLSFELAERRLSADVLGVAAGGSSVSKGETLKDTARNIEAMKVDMVVMRHSASGATHYLSKVIESNVVNAGDGQPEPPTQALLDMYTIRERIGRLEGLHVGILGDISHSRVARSNIWGLTKMGARVIGCGPSTLIPADLDKMGVTVSHRIDEVIPEADVLMVLRLQHERMSQGLLPSLREYARWYGLNSERLRRAKRDVLIMHPGPINRGVELSPEVADGPYSVILEQVTNGVAVRMAILYLLSQGERQETTVAGL